MKGVIRRGRDLLAGEISLIRAPLSFTARRVHTVYGGLGRHCQQILRHSLRLLKRCFNGFIVFVVSTRWRSQSP